MRQRDRHIQRIREVEREHSVGLAASEALDHVLAADSAFLTSRQLQHHDLVRYRQKLDATYIIRMYAAFEDTLRDIWSAMVRQTEPPMSQLLPAIAARFAIPTDYLTAADRLRVLRNELVHADAIALQGGGPISLIDARQRICRFISRLPPNW